MSNGERERSGASSASEGPSHASPRRGWVVGTPVDAVTIPEGVRIVRAWVRESPARFRQVVTVNPEFVVLARRDPHFRAVLERADLSTPDGTGVLIAARSLGFPVSERVGGNDLAEALIASRDPELRFFLLGAAPGIADRAAARLRRRYPGCAIAGTWSGSPRPEDAPGILERLRQATPTVLLVAFGTPAQELWIDRHRPDLASSGVRVAIGVGGTFDQWAGVVHRAPLMVQRIGLEWLYRLARQPWRWRRQLALPVFVLLFLREWLRVAVVPKAKHQ
ncbi:MAG: WecB/TagA/CpsF family glycosyltransferase [Chloroflexi bacterium]|nr:WecB/TagA/CpsF family glycosyltransferase [Chloroflexota bacterium]